MTQIASANDEAIEAWNGVLFDRFLQYRHLIVTSLGEHGVEAMRVAGPDPGDRVLDIGCGFGDASQDLARLVGPGGSVIGVDAAERFVELAREEASQTSLENLGFDVMDVQAGPFEQQFDYAFSRFGTMFFANPVAAMRNVREALKPGGKLCMVVWRQKVDNHWLYKAEQAVEQFVQEPEESDEPTCGPGPFSMANADTTTGILLSAGFTDISLRRCELEVLVGRDLEEAVAMAMAIGPAGEVIRLARDEAEKIRQKLTEAVTDALAEFETPAGTRTNSSSWIVTATAPHVGA